MHDNARVIERFQRSRPTLVGLRRAGDVVPQLEELAVLHAGPPIAAEAMNGPMRGAVVGGLIYEGLERAEAERRVASGRVTLIPTNAIGFVAPLSGVVTRSMPVWFIEDAEYGNKTYANLNEGLGKVLRFGAYGEEVIERLSWMQRVLAPTLENAIERRGPMDLKDFLAEGLRRGDECHNRNKACTSSFAREFAPAIATVAPTQAPEVLEFLRHNDHFCLNLSIAASKCSADAAHDAGCGSIVTSMASNGREFGLRVSGLGDTWIVAPAGRAEGSFFKGFSAADAACDMGDSYISEVVGLGGFAMAAAPAIAPFVGGRPSAFARWTEEMYRITLAEHEQFRIPSLDFRGAPLGIDVHRVLETRMLPVLNSGIAHKDAGIGQVGAGLARPPIECFEKAAAAVGRPVAVAE